MDVTSELSEDLVKVCTEKGWEATKTWADETNYDRMVDAVGEFDRCAESIIERMIALRPKTPSAVAITAATLKENSLSHYWNEPEEDRDFDVRLITRFLDGLIELGAARGDADRVDDAREAAR